MKRELQSNLNQVIALEFKDHSSAAVGNVLDTADYDGGLMYTFVSGSTTATGTTVTPEVQESDSTGSTTFTAAAASDLYYPSSTDPETSAVITGASKVGRISYIGSKRYSRIKLTPSAAAITGSVANRAPENMPESN